jgi:CRISPR-associated protein Cas1
MIKRLVEVSSGPTHLSLRLNQLVLTRAGETIAVVPIEDLGVLVVDHPACSYTHSALTALAENNVAVVVCGRNHHPACMLIPAEGHSTQAEAIAAQAAASEATRNRLWKQIVRAKINAQAELLERLRIEAGALREMTRRVRTGDPENLEAQAARRYWSVVMGPGFRRDRDGSPPNGLLNYGYMVLRAATARAICGAGLCPSLGLYHRNRYNAFALADDLMEPLRPIVDAAVRRLWDQGEGELSKPVRAELLGVLARPVLWKDESSPLLIALARYAASIREVLAGRLKRPYIPTFLPVSLPDRNSGPGCVKAKTPAKRCEDQT